MEIYWKNKRVRAEMEDSKYLLKHFDKKEVKNINAIFFSLKRARVLAELPRRFRCHLLKGEKKGQFAIDIPGLKGKRGGNRLLLRPAGENAGETDLSKIECIQVFSIENYHK